MQMKARLQWKYSTALTWSLMNLIFASTWSLVVSTILTSFSSPLSLKTYMITQQSLFVSKLCYRIWKITPYQWINHAPHVSRSINWKLVAWIYWSIEIYMSSMNVHIHGVVKLSSHVLSIFLLHISTFQSLMFHSMKIKYVAFQLWCLTLQMLLPQKPMSDEDKKYTIYIYFSPLILSSKSITEFIWLGSLSRRWSSSVPWSMINVLFSTKVYSVTCFIHIPCSSVSSYLIIPVDVNACSL